MIFYIYSPRATSALYIARGIFAVIVLRQARHKAMVLRIRHSKGVRPTSPPNHNCSQLLAACLHSPSLISFVFILEHIFLQAT